MSPNKSAPSPNIPNASTNTKPDKPSVDDSPYKVGVELEHVSPAAGESSSTTTRPRANRDTARPLRSMCFMVGEDCKWCCRPEAKTQAGGGPGPGTVSEEEEEESPAVDALRECLETLERDRLEAKTRRAKCPTLVQRCLNICGKAV